MSGIDQRVFFTSLGFLAVMLTDVPRNKQEQRIKNVAHLIEEFCKITEPEKNLEDQKNTAEIADRMTTTIAKILTEKGNCRAHELKDKGFSADEIAIYWPMAYARACVLPNIEPKNS